MPNIIRSLAYAMALACALAPTLAQAQARLDSEHWYIAGKFTLGAGGTVDTESENVGDENDLAASFGMAAQFVVPVHRYFALGGTVGLLSWQSAEGSDRDLSRNLLFDLAVLPMGRYQVLDSLELYATMPIGLSIDSLNEIDRRNLIYLPVLGLGATVDIEGDTAAGFVIGVLFGVRWQVARPVGVMAELGYMYRTFSHSISATDGTTTIRGQDISVSFGQFAFNFGAYF